jgi:hypothetical protein
MALVTEAAGAMKIGAEGEDRNTWRRFSAMPLPFPQIPHELTCYGSGAATVESLLLTT